MPLFTLSNKHSIPNRTKKSESVYVEVSGVEEDGMSGRGRRAKIASFTALAHSPAFGMYNLFKCFFNFKLHNSLLV